MTNQKKPVGVPDDVKFKYKKAYPLGYVRWTGKNIMVSRRVVAGYPMQTQFKKYHLSKRTSRWWFRAVLLHQERGLCTIRLSSRGTWSAEYAIAHVLRSRMGSQATVYHIGWWEPFKGHLMPTKVQTRPGVFEWRGTWEVGECWFEHDDVQDIVAGAFGSTHILLKQPAEADGVLPD